MEETFRTVAGYIALGVEMAATPTWLETGQLAAIAVIRTFLNYFLEKDLEGAARETRA